ncbi:hypothetical protein D3C79_876560 [compost metagenome]
MTQLRALRGFDLIDAQLPAYPAQLACSLLETAGELALRLGQCVPTAAADVPCQVRQRRGISIGQVFQAGRCHVQCLVLLQLGLLTGNIA